MKLNYLALLISELLCLLCCAACKKPAATPPINSGTAGTVNTTTTTSLFANGADVSWITQMEASGIRFYNNSGVQEDLLQILKEKGINSIRLRAWVNPADGWCNTDDVVKKALRAQAAGMHIMIDFHYSDTWADPGAQTKPAAWSNLNFTDLKTAMSTYTATVLKTLKAKGITPKWVQIGNETSDGLLWEDGHASKSMANFAALISTGYNAVKSADTSIKVIVHLNNGYDSSLYNWLFSGLKNNGAQWDIIGMSLYPTVNNWQTLDQQCVANINSLISTYHTPVMICEVGMENDQPSVTKSFLTDIISKVKSVDNNNGLGVFYWEPEVYNWQNYGLGAFDKNGQPTVALDAFNN